MQLWTDIDTSQYTHRHTDTQTHRDAYGDAHRVTHKDVVRKMRNLTNVAQRLRHIT